MTAVAGSDLYGYTGQNRLEQPEYYFYSRFHGQSFLTAYRQVRAHHRARLVHELQDRVGTDPGDGVAQVALVRAVRDEGLVASDVASVLGADGLTTAAIEVKSEGAPESLPRSESLEFVEVPWHLQTLATTVLACDPPLNPALVRWLDEFLKRFEVSKRLYARYTAAFRRVGDEQAPVSSYGLLSLALAVGYRRTNRLKWLNGLLKVNDVVCSLPPTLLDRTDLVLAVAAIDSEGQAVRHLAETQGVSW